MKAPRTRADCEQGPRPCPWTRCRHALPGGACALDFAAEYGGEVSAADVAAALQVSRQRVLQLEASGLRKLRALIGA